MLSMADTFVKYLQANCGSIATVNWVRARPSDANAHILKDDALNVSFLTFPKKNHDESALVSLDVLGSDERTTVGQAERIRDVLCAAQYTPEMTYTPDPSNPVPTGRNIEWSGNIEFQVLASAHNYVHLNATFTIRRVR